MTDKKQARHQSNKDVNAPDDESAVEGHVFSGNQSRKDSKDDKSLPRAPYGNRKEQ